MGYRLWVIGFLFIEAIDKAIKDAHPHKCRVADHATAARS